jgi:hypothetical protein
MATLCHFFSKKEALQDLQPFFFVAKVDPDPHEI